MVTQNHHIGETTSDWCYVLYDAECGFSGGVIAFTTLECSTGFECAVPFHSFIPLRTTAVYSLFLLRAFFSACYVALCLMQHICVDTMSVDMIC